MLPDWAKVINENTGIYCDGSCETQINRLRNALEIAMEVLDDQKDVTFKVHLNRKVIGPYGYESGSGDKKEYKSAGEALKKIREIGGEK